jgi:hypothetical protein
MPARTPELAAAIARKTNAHKPNARRGTRMVLQAKALNTAAEWAQAYAKLAKEKDALAKEKDALTSVTKEKEAQLSVLTKENRILTSEKDALASGLAAVAKEKDALAKEKDALAKQLSQCTALANLTGARRPRLRGPLSPLGTFFLRSPLHVRCVQLQRRSTPQTRCRRGKQPPQVPSPRRDTRAL